MIQIARRQLKILEIGPGKVPEKIMALAKKHQRHNFTAVEKELSEHERIISSRGLRKKLQNLTIHQNTGAIAHLSGKKDSYHHIYAHFWGSVSRHKDRVETFHKAFSALKKNGRLVLIDEAHFGKQMEIELHEAGFKVTRKYLTVEEIRKLNTPFSTGLANDLVETQRLHEKIKKDVGEATFEKQKLNLARYAFGRGIARFEGSNPSRETLKAIETTLGESHRFFTSTPFVKLIATKR